MHMNDGSVWSFLVVGLLAFALGVCVTVFCFLLKKKKSRNESKDE